MSIRIITDSASDISTQYARQHGVIVMPLPTLINGKEYRDGVDISHEEFFRILPSCEELPVTSQVPPGDFLSVYREIRDAGDTAVVITLSGKLSGTCQSATFAAEDFSDCVAVVDSMSATIGERILVEYALLLLRGSTDFLGLAAELKTVRDRLCLIGRVETLEYLMRGGRITRTAGFAGSLLHIKPVLHMQNGELVMLGKSRGTKQSARLLNKAINDMGGIDFSMPYMLAYAGLDKSLLLEYIEDSRDIWAEQPEPLPVSTIGSTIGTHTGPGMIALAFFSNNTQALEAFR